MKEELTALLAELGVSWSEESENALFVQNPRIALFLFYVDHYSFTNFETIERLQRQGIRVVALWEDVWKKKSDLIKKRLAGEIIGRRRVFARNCTLHPIDKEEADSFFEATHLLGTAKAKYRYGLFHIGALVAAAAFSGMRLIHQKETNNYSNTPMHRSAEWIRYSSLPHITVTGGMSKLLSSFVAEHHPDDVMSYANKDWSEGSAYNQLGFIKVGEVPIQSYWLDPQTFKRFPKKRHPNPLPHWKEIFSLGSAKYIKTYV